ATVSRCLALHILLALVCVDRPALAQPVAESWTTEQGLPQNVVRAVRQTRDHYLWVATMDGLARFDGVRFTIFDRGNTPGVDPNRCNAIQEDPDGTLWFAGESGITRFRDGIFKTYSSRDGLPPGMVFGITGDEQGHVWALVDGQIFAWDRERFSGPLTGA